MVIPVKLPTRPILVVAVVLFLSVIDLADARAVFKNFVPQGQSNVILPSNNRVRFKVTATDNAKRVSVRRVWVEIKVNGVKVGTPRIMSRQGTTNNYIYRYAGLQVGDRCCYRIKQRNTKGTDTWSGTRCFNVFGTPTAAPSPLPSMRPSASPAPSFSPTALPSEQPTVSLAPSCSIPTHDCRGVLGSKGTSS